MVPRHSVFLILCFIFIACMRPSLACAGAEVYRIPTLTVNESKTPAANNSDQESEAPVAPDENESEETSSSDVDVEDYVSLLAEFTFQFEPHFKLLPKNEDATSFANDPLTYPP